MLKQLLINPQFPFLFSKTRYLSFLVIIFSLVTPFTASAGKYGKYQRIELSSCEINISADRTYPNKNGITYSGNVKVLIGFANLRVDKVTLVKKKDGSCELVSDFND